MFYNVQFDIDNFEFWSGAKAKVDSLTYEQKQALEAKIEEIFEYDNDVTDTDINDFVWFDCMYIVENSYGMVHEPDITIYTTFEDDEFMYDEELQENIELGYARIIEM